MNVHKEKNVVKKGIVEKSEKKKEKNEKNKMWKMKNEMQMRQFLNTLYIRYDTYIHETSTVVRVVTGT